MHRGFVREVRVYIVRGGRRHGQCWKSLAWRKLVSDKSLKKAKSKMKNIYWLDFILVM